MYATHREPEATTERQPETSTFIRIGQGRPRGTLWLEEAALEDEVVRGFDGASEQCDGCGTDICESGKVVGNAGNQQITCTECGAEYPVRTT